MTTNGTHKTNGARELPPASSALLFLDHPTPEEALHQLHQNAAMWSGALSEDAYLRREDYLASQDATKGGGITYWVLVDSKDHSTRQVLSGCETYQKRAFVARGGKVHEQKAHGIGSVFTPPKFRGKSYARRMMDEVGNVLETWQSEEKCPFSVLFSDIGKKFYAAHGWQPYPAAHVSLPSTKAAPTATLPEARPLYAEDLPELCKRDEELIKESMIEAAADGKSHIALIPDISNIRWHHAREEFVGFEIHGRKPDVKGAIVGTEIGSRVWCYWTRMYYNPDPKDPKDNTLHILRLVVEEHGIVDWEKNTLTEDEKSRYSPAIAALLTYAQREAAEWNTDNVEIWNPNAVTLEAARMILSTAEVVDREDESIPSLRWHPSGQAAEACEVVSWLGNEKYGWC